MPNRTDEADWTLIRSDTHLGHSISFDLDGLELCWHLAEKAEKSKINNQHHQNKSTWSKLIRVLVCKLKENQCLAMKNNEL